MQWANSCCSIHPTYPIVWHLMIANHYLIKHDFASYPIHFPTLDRGWHRSRSRYIQDKLA